MALNRRQALTMSLSIGALACTRQARAAAWPARPIKVLVGGAAGAVPDTLARLVGEGLSSRLGQPFIIDDRPGAGGIRAMEALIASAADGYTLAVATISQAVMNRYMYSNLPYEPQRDLLPVAKLVTTSFLIAANPSVRGSTLEEMITLGKSRSDGLLIGIPSNGSPPHVAAILLLQETELRARFIPFRSGPDALSSAIRGDIDLLIDGPTIIAPQVERGTLKAIVATGRQRLEVLPHVPTLAEAGFAQAESESWMGLVAPRGTPPELVRRLSDECDAALKIQALVAKMKVLSFMPSTTSPDEFAHLIELDHQRWSKVLQKANLKLD